MLLFVCDETRIRAKLIEGRGAIVMGSFLIIAESSSQTQCTFTYNLEDRRRGTRAIKADTLAETGPSASYAPTWARAMRQAAIRALAIMIAL
jgi:hypothetical protein